MRIVLDENEFFYNLNKSYNNKRIEKIKAIKKDLEDYKKITFKNQ